MNRNGNKENQYYNRFRSIYFIGCHVLSVSFSLYYDYSFCLLAKRKKIKRIHVFVTRRKIHVYCSMRNLNSLRFSMSLSLILCFCMPFYLVHRITNAYCVRLWRATTMTSTFSVSFIQYCILNIAFVLLTEIPFCVFLYFHVLSLTGCYNKICSPLFSFVLVVR